jgi:DNA replication protein DnaC
MTQVNDIRKAFYEEGQNISQIARNYGVDRKTVRRYINKTDWNQPEVITMAKNSFPKLTPYKEKIDCWLKDDKKARRLKRIDRLIKTAGFVNTKSLENFDWSPVTLPDTTSKIDLVELKFIERCENIIAVGAVGTGKTFLATAFGLRACTKDKLVRFYRCLDLVNTLLESHRQGRLKKMMAQLSKAELLIIDELGFVPLHRDGAELLFNVVAQAYEKQSVIITSNLQFGHWNSVLGDNRLTAAMIDRLVHHAHILAFTGESFRLKQALSGVKNTGIDDQEVRET